MEKNYEPSSVETKWYDEWKERGSFSPSTQDGSKPAYSISIPPPNVTGSLHMGHALSYTVQDIMGRWKRMSGFNVLILPGIDHAGIATQNVVEKEIAAEGLTRQDLGRDKFVERVWNWKERYGARIVLQMERLGCAFDWTRERFTMDDSYVDAILEEFVRFYDQGLIYKGARVINWCPFHETAISDIEVEYVERDSHLWHIRYPFADGSGEVVVATTRPETMLGDTAVAVNPDDARYFGQVGKTLILPLLDREIPLIADYYASLEFGTGAVKVTPAHDLNDFECGLRHRLPQIVVIGGDGRMTAAAGDNYAGLTREEAREAIVKDLAAAGVLVKVDDYKHSVGTCERCHTIIEPLLSEQWFVKMAGTDLINRTISAIDTEKVTFIPDRYKRISLDWLENIRDWCISRQLWWGHRIPVYYAHDGRYTAAKTREEAAVKLGIDDAESLRQDDDVLDTWFSSALWPFATLGWPNETADLKAFYPTNALFTAREILFLWVARMIMTGIEFVGDIPFSDVYVHATVLDKLGRRMSKSLGNGIDPIEMIDKYGADALRFSLVRLASKGQDIRYSEDRIPEARNFCTKIWNASRFALMNLEDYTPGETFSAYSLPEQWILSRFNAAVRTVTKAIGEYDIDEACRSLYEFFWNDYCDWFLELSKPALRSDDPNTKLRSQFVLLHVLESSLRLLHPLMPFITEEIWQSLPGTGGTIMYADYPVVDESLIDPSAEEAMNAVIDSIRAVRNARGELSIPPSQTIDAVIVASPEYTEILSQNESAFTGLARTKPQFASTKPIEDGTVALPITAGLDIYLPLAGLIDVEKEKARIGKEIAAIEKDIAINKAKLDNPNFVSRAAPEVVAKAQALLQELTDKLAKLNEQMSTFSAS